MKQLNWYQIFGKSNIPDGRTVLPTDDIQIWLHCANIWNKTYTTLAEILADTDTLLALISSNNAVDYMVRSTTWANGTAFVPTMTSNTTPEGVAKATSEDSGREAYRAFDGDDSTAAAMATGNRVAYIQYKCATARKVEAFAFNCVWNPVEGCTLEVSCSDDGNTWSSCGTYIYSSSDNGKTKQYLLNADYGTHLYWRITRTLDTNSRGAIANTVQFYSAFVTASATAMSYIGLNNYASNTLLADATWCNAICNSAYFESVLNVKVPTMTSNTTPSGEAFASSVLDNNSSYYAYKVFDSNASTLWISDRGATSPSNPQYVGYEFTTPAVVTLAVIENSNQNRNIPKDYILQAYDNGSWVDKVSGQNTTTGSNAKWRVVGNSADKCSKWRLYVTSILNSAGSGNVELVGLQFYGRKDV